MYFTALIIQRSTNLPCVWLNNWNTTFWRSKKQNKTKTSPLTNALIQSNFIAQLEITSKQNQPVTKSENRSFPVYRKQKGPGVGLEKMVEKEVNWVRRNKVQKIVPNP